jgi:hypothetical protein
MSANSKINDSPGHFMVLQAIARGLDTVDKIARAPQTVLMLLLAQVYIQ